MSFPRFFTAEQLLADRRIDDLGSAVRSIIESNDAMNTIHAGQSVAIAVGSRGIDCIDLIVSEVVGCLQRTGATPFIVPAMGSHGGATDEGQAAILAGLGITAESMGCPIQSSLQTVEIGCSSGGIPLYCDQFAFHADHVIAINRIKPHTRLTGTLQSGLCKMLMIGLGKHRGALTFHPAFESFDYCLDKIADDIVTKIVSAIPFTFGIALIEDAFDHVGHVELIRPDQLLQRESELLVQAMSWMPTLPFDDAELLIVDEIGKEISGTGLDTNIVGRKWHDKMAGPDEWPKISEIYVRSLTERTAGNASGIGIAEYTNESVVQSIDHNKTRVNCITAGHPTAAAVPVWFPNDRDVFNAVCAQYPKPANERRWLRIRNTLDLKTIQCSEAYYQLAQENPGLKITAALSELPLDDSGMIAPIRTVA